MPSILAANALTTLALLKGDLGITDSSLDATLERYINVASQAIETECGRAFGKATVTELLKGAQGPRLVLERTPIVSITSVKQDGAALDTSEYSTEDATAGILYRATGWPMLYDFGTAIEGDGIPGTERKRFEVVYVGGYVLPNALTGTRDLPYDLEEAALISAVSLYRRRGVDQGITSESLGDASVVYGGRNTAIGRGGGLPDAALAILDKYRRWVTS